ncbi:ParB N-terminal domain-containing protein [Aestuariicella hydrocarbonica]|uniref:ParB N-terminal domain-containing protein n=1 Tax=Pseudomaricurvus hydrocarbonicus TaxID=1470433 RepID=A0A9E5JSA8_9GAMM|nr:ParB N-terminal domain-containing protein [Aestuariicella hydrocarbonica]NHO65907.1 ParB N-terminal domain-containing protein [Aestuariicella hydrocarbonica]
MAKKFGGKRAGTGSIISESNTENAEKWAGAAKAQVETAQKVKGVLTKTIPIDYITTDPDNPRKLAVNQAQVKELAIKFPMDLDALSSEDPSDWLEDYAELLTQESGLSGKALGDVLSIAQFAAALKTPERMINPITVWQDESQFHLIAGERRFLAHILLGARNIAARIQQNNIARNEIDALQWEENVHRENMNLWEKMDRVKKLLEAGEGVQKTSVTKLSKIIGRSRAEAQRYLSVLRYPNKALVMAVEKGKITDLKRAAQLAQMPEEQVLSIINGDKSAVRETKPAIKLARHANTRGLSKLLQAAAIQLNAQELLDDYDLNKQPQLAAALEALSDRAEQ